MNRTLRGAGRRLRRAWWLPAAAASMAVAMMAPVSTSAASPPSEGLVCTSNPTANFVLTARTGYVTTPDLNSIFMWSYASGNGRFQYPGPYLCVNEGDTVTITLRNTLAVPTSIMFPGIAGVRADGAPAQPDLARGSLTKVAPAGGAVTYSFTAASAGTYLYESGTDPETQVRMGLVGALVVRPAGHADSVYDPQPGYPGTQFNPAHEYVHLLTELDPDMHQAYELGKPFDLTQYRARYFMINGRSFPDTIAPNYSAHLPAQPYGSLVHVTPRNAQNPLPAVVRYLNAGPVEYPFHPHSNHERIVGTDGRQLVNPSVVDVATGAVADTSEDHFAIVVPPGQTQEGFFTWQDAQQWDPNTNAIGVPIPSIQDRTEGAYWGGSPYLGVQSPTELTQAGGAQYNQCGEFYHVAHSHALFQATNYGLQTGTGMLTMIRVDPVDPNNPGQPRPDCVR
jgi:FtsP/CotA-like multicopper oxidase with cupredoxin domain